MGDHCHPRLQGRAESAAWPLQLAGDGSGAGDGTRSAALKGHREMRRADSNEANRAAELPLLLQQLVTVVRRISCAAVCLGTQTSFAHAFPGRHKRMIRGAAARSMRRGELLPLEETLREPRLTGLQSSRREQ
jgi:hypothetical protein